MGKFPTLDSLTSWMGRTKSSDGGVTAGNDDDVDSEMAAIKKSSIVSDSVSNSRTNGGKAYERFQLQTNGQYDYKFEVEDLDEEDNNDGGGGRGRRTSSTSVSSSSNKTKKNSLLSIGGSIMDSLNRGVKKVTTNNKQRNTSAQKINDGVRDDEETLDSNDEDQHRHNHNSKALPATVSKNPRQFSFYDRRERSQKVALLALGMFFLVMFVGLMPLASKKRSRNAGYASDAFRSNADTIICSSADGSGNGGDVNGGTKISFQQWMKQDPTTDITGLCDPVFMKMDWKADASRTPVKVFILMGEANMAGSGTIKGVNLEGTLEHTVSQKGRFVHLLDPETKTWSARNDVRYVSVHENFQVTENKWLQVDSKSTYFGMEAQLGYILGEVLEEPVLIIKVASGHNSLGGDILPPGSEQYQMDGFVYAGSDESPRRWDIGTTPSPDNWRAGARYHEYVSNVKHVLRNIGHYYPGASTYEISGFVWWQGDSDRRVDAYAAKYEANLVRLINSLRFDFRAPNSKFVVATIGHNGADMKQGTLQVWESQQAVSDHEKYPQYKTNVATVDIRSSWRGPYLPGHSSGSSETEYLDGPHYGSNAEVQLEVGNAVGLKMAQLLAAAAR
mmetsp:Transcript_40048/g.96704  ORF Transcript_40048/g.96704 Transcript_40048/m.96704 type:complete len:617 (-) Transcript_40048:164-2014(-)